jgi:hypothetical protein
MVIFFPSKGNMWQNYFLSPQLWKFCRQKKGCSSPLLEYHYKCLVRDPAKIFLTSKFSYLLFCNPTPKTETGNGDMWELLIAHHLKQSLCLANQKHGAGVRSYLLHSSLAHVHSFAEHICRRSKTIFPELNRHILTFLHLMLSICGDALRQASTCKRPIRATNQMWHLSQCSSGTSVSYWKVFLKFFLTIGDIPHF